MGAVATHTRLLWLLDPLHFQATPWPPLQRAMKPAFSLLRQRKLCPTRVPRQAVAAPHAAPLPVWALGPSGQRPV